MNYKPRYIHSPKNGYLWVLAGDIVTTYSIPSSLFIYINGYIGSISEYLGGSNVYKFYYNENKAISCLNNAMVSLFYDINYRIKKINTMKPILKNFNSIENGFIWKRIPRCLKNNMYSQNYNMTRYCGRPFYKTKEEANEELNLGIKRLISQIECEKEIVKNLLDKGFKFNELFRNT